MHGVVTAEEVPSPLKNPEFSKLLAISITVALGYGMVVPVLPRYAESFGVSIAVVGLVQLVFGLTRFSFGLVGGLVVDRFGERLCTLAGLLIVSVSSFAAGAAQTFTQLVLARGFGGAGSAFFIAGLMNRILRIIEPAAMGRATGQFRSSFLIGLALGPFLGGLVNEAFGLAAPFYFYGGGLLVATVVAMVVMGKAGLRRAERRSPLQALRAARPMFRDYRYVMATAATFVGWWAISGPVQTIGPIYAAQELGFSAFLIGVAIAMPTIGEAGVLFPAGRAADRYGRKPVLLPSVMAMAVGLALAGTIGDLSWAYFPALVLVGAGIAGSSVAAGALIADAIPREGSGTAVAINQMAGDLGYLLSPTIIGWLAEHAGFPLAYGAGALPAVAVFVLALRMRAPAPARI